MQTVPCLLAQEHDIIPAERLRFALLAGRDEDLRRHIQQAAARAPEVRQQIRRLAQVRPVRIRGLRGGQVHLLAMPMSLNFGSRRVVSPAEVRLFTPGTEMASRMNAWWRCAMSSQARDVVALPYAVHLEAVLGISPTDVYELAFFGASLFEGSRQQLPEFRLADRYARETGEGLAAPYLLMALVTCADDLEVDQSAWRRSQFAAETLLAAGFSTSECQPRVSLSPPAGFFEAVDAAQERQLAQAVEWVAGIGGTHQIELRPRNQGHIAIELRYDLPGLERGGRITWAYDSTWRELPNLVDAAGAAGSLNAVDRVGPMTDASFGCVGNGPLH